MPQVPTKKTGFAELSPQQREDRRTKIGVRVQAILNQFWVAEGTPDVVQSLEMEGWMDALETCSHSEIREAWRDYQRDGPRTRAGRLARPDAGALYRIIKAKRPRPQPPAALDPPEPRAKPIVSAEKRAEILASAGYEVNEHGGINGLASRLAMPVPKQMPKGDDE